MRDIRNDHRVEQLKHTFAHSNGSAYKHAADELSNCLTNEEIIELLRERLSRYHNLPHNDRFRRVLLFPELKDLRRKVISEERLWLYELADNPLNYRDEFDECKQGVSIIQLERFKEAINYSTVHPRSAISKSTAIREDQEQDGISAKYRRFFNVFDEAFAQPYVSAEFSPYFIYPKGQSTDRSLALMWMENVSKHREYEEAKMLSARFAEVVASRFYASLGFQVEDISLKQVSGESEDWKRCDLLLKGTIPVDVKNARNTYYQKSGYVEYCVPNFKYGRDGREVLVAGVYSPYVKLEAFNDHNKLPKRLSNIIFLGETRHSDIKTLETVFETNLIYISIDKSTIPPWVFDYPDKYYQRQDAARQQLLKLEPLDIPSYQDIERRGRNPLPIYVIAGDRFSSSWDVVVNGWEMDFIRRLHSSASVERVSLSVLYLTILSHFLTMAIMKEPPDDYNPIKYRKLLYTTYLKEEEDAEEICNPLGINDPINIIDQLITTLSTVWEHRFEIGLSEYEVFRFSGLGLLRGKRRLVDIYESIIAYCGGEVKGKGKCGFSPLIRGKHKTCQVCGKLICDKCGYCSKNCSGNRDRISEQHSQSEDLYVYFDEIDFFTDYDPVVEEPEWNDDFVLPY